MPTSSQIRSKVSTVDDPQIIQDEMSLEPHGQRSVRYDEEAYCGESLCLSSSGSSCEEGGFSDESADDLTEEVGVSKPMHTSDITKRIGGIVLKHHFSHQVVNDIACRIRDTGFKDVPNDARTISETKGKAAILDDDLIHLGLRRKILLKLGSGSRHCEHRVELHVNIDGLALYKSLSTCLWPILC